MKAARVLVFALVILILACSGSALSSEKQTLNADTALQQLMDGNKRYSESMSSHPNQTAERRKEVVGGQHPFAVIVGCSDSRVPPEIIFDQGVGDLFIIRIAGNIVDDAALGSVEYAVEHLGVPLVVVLGHQQCGAVKATIQGGEAPGHIGSIVKAIEPAVTAAKEQPGDLLDNSVKTNVKMIVQKMKSSKPILDESISHGKLKVIGAYYSLENGNVVVVD